MERPARYVPSEFRDLAEKSTLQAKENYDKLKNAPEEVICGFKDAYDYYHRASAMRIVERIR